MGKQIKIFEIAKTLKPRLTAIERKQKKELQALFNSGQEMNQRLAWGLCEQMGLTKKKLLSDFWLKEFDKKYLDIEARMGNDYAEGKTISHGRIDVFEIEILGVAFSLFDDGDECKVRFYYEKGSEIAWECNLVYWKPNEGIDSFLNNVRLCFKNYLISNIHIFN